MLHERIISQNNYQKIVGTGNGPAGQGRRKVLEEDDTEMKLARLWSFQNQVIPSHVILMFSFVTVLIRPNSLEDLIKVECNETNTVTELAWNKATGHCRRCLWSNKGQQNKGEKWRAWSGVLLNLKNLDYPERVTTPIKRTQYHSGIFYFNNAGLQPPWTWRCW